MHVQRDIYYVQWMLANCWSLRQRYHRLAMIFCAFLFSSSVTVFKCLFRFGLNFLTFFVWLHGIKLPSVYGPPEIDTAFPLSFFSQPSLYFTRKSNGRVVHMQQFHYTFWSKNFKLPKRKSIQNKQKANVFLLNCSSP